ncbi:MAG: glutathione S-transferase N-terminal domain-containing protein [Leptospira bouyouniensis]|uniref:Glutaredoxin n=1 Tax=Leptospira bouyouniensis TaxID=2484911 RepID=A0A7I0HQV2_9LEPT|nr:glutathione S-transferase N-terminal domain-containing protein [Leptospira bouyouniensis]TGK48470.1 glutaredoxin [Leptospira bouyouniensis]TGL04442.1 glutaredoxin [Leptospira bouyouniensis]TGM80857.1 glutaredoxin [Leptospira bouyouniensis]
MIRLYQYDSCPYCYRVRQSIQALGLKEGKDYELVEARNGTKGREEVIRLGGISQVPFLVDGEIKMYESLDIIDYIQNKFSKT